IRGYACSIARNAAGDRSSVTSTSAAVASSITRKGPYEARADCSARASAGETKRVADASAHASAPGAEVAASAAAGASGRNASNGEARMGRIEGNVPRAALSASEGTGFRWDYPRWMHLGSTGPFQGRYQSARGGE